MQDPKVQLKKIIIGTGAMIFFSISSFGFAQNPLAVPGSVTSPAQLSRWFTAEFKYETEMPDRWASPEETLSLKKGDCEDFAVLAQVVLARLGISSDVIIISFKGLNQGHAVCLFKNGATYSFISSQKLIRTHGVTVTEAIQEKYPDWEKLVFTTADGQDYKILVRDPGIPAETNHMNVASRR